jgi:hypothetical protein
MYSVLLGSNNRTAGRWFNLSTEIYDYSETAFSQCIMFSSDVWFLSQLLP